MCVCVSELRFVIGLWLRKELPYKDIRDNENFQLQSSIFFVIGILFWTLFGETHHMLERRRGEAGAQLRA